MPYKNNCALLSYYASGQRRATARQEFINHSPITQCRQDCTLSLPVRPPATSLATMFAASNASALFVTACSPRDARSLPRRLAKYTPPLPLPRQYNSNSLLRDSEDAPEKKQPGTLLIVLHAAQPDYNLECLPERGVTGAFFSRNLGIRKLHPA